MKKRVDSHIPEFKIRTESELNRILEGVAREIERDAKMVVPLKKGTLQSSIKVNKVAPLKYKVTAGEFPNLPYALFQEKGGDSTRRVRNYTTPGTGKNYLGATGDRIMLKTLSRLKSQL